MAERHFVRFRGATAIRRPMAPVLGRPRRVSCREDGAA